MSDELVRFKKEINLAEYAASKGFVLDKNKSGRTSLAMRRHNQKIGISVNRRTGDQNFHDFGTGKGGTVIDFCQTETGKNLGQTRQELRVYIGSPRPQIHISRPAPRPTPEQQAITVAQEKASLEPLGKNEYLEGRGITQEILSDPRFRENVRTDHKGNVCFPHNNEYGFCGSEKKNAYFTGFTPNGDKGLWFSRVPQKFEKIVVCESGIDALSHAELHPGNNAAYISVGGQMSQEQEELLRGVVERNKNKEIVGAFDNDEAGHKYAATLEKICKEKGGSFKSDCPEKNGQDWNEQLQKRNQDRFVEIKRSANMKRKKEYEKSRGMER